MKDRLSRDLTVQNPWLAPFRRSVGLPCTLPARLLRGLSNQQSLGVPHASSTLPRRYIQAVAVESVRHEHAPRHATMLRSRLQRWSLGMWEMRQGEIPCTISTLRALNGIKMFAQGALLGGRTTTTSAIMMRAVEMTHLKESAKLALSTSPSTCRVTSFVCLACI
jgi:hypothetical protein